MKVQLSEEHICSVHECQEEKVLEKDRIVCYQVECHGSPIICEECALHPALEIKLNKVLISEEDEM